MCVGAAVMVLVAPSRGVCLAVNICGCFYWIKKSEVFHYIRTFILTTHEIKKKKQENALTPQFLININTNCIMIY